MPVTFAPITDDPDAPSLDVASGAAAALLDRLDLEAEPHGELDAEDFLGRALVAAIGRDDSGGPDTITCYPDGMVVVHSGQRAGYLAECLDALADIGTWAWDHGVPVCWFWLPCY